MEYAYMLVFCGIAFVGFGAFVLSAFDPAFIQPLMDSVNFANPLLVILVLLGVVMVFGGWVVNRQRHN